MQETIRREKNLEQLSEALESDKEPQQKAEELDQYEGVEAEVYHSRSLNVKISTDVYDEQEVIDYFNNGSPANMLHFEEDEEGKTTHVEVIDDFEEEY